jgi:hypothetical protein
MDQRMRIQVEHHADLPPRRVMGIVVKAFLAACLAAIVLAVIALIILDRVQEPADRAFTTPYTRVGD